MPRTTSPSQNNALRLSLDIWSETGLLQARPHAEGTFYSSDMFASPLFHFFCPQIGKTALKPETIDVIRETGSGQNMAPAIYAPDTLVDILPLAKNDTLMHEVFMMAKIRDVLIHLPDARYDALDFKRTQDFQDPDYLATYNDAFLSADGNSEYDLIYKAFPHLYQNAVDGRASFSPWIIAGTCEGKPATSVTMIPKGRLVGLYNLATRPDFRGQGLAHQTIREALIKSFNDGARKVFLVTDSHSRLEQTYQRMGFKPIARYTGLTFE